MGLNRRSLNILVIVLVIVFLIGGIVGIWLRLMVHQRYIDLEVWPRSDELESSTWEQPLIQYRTSDAGSWQPWVRRVDEFLKAYDKESLSKWMRCPDDNAYGYASGAPCVFLRLAHVHNWIPKPFNLSTPLPPGMPDNLKNFITSHARLGRGEVEDYVWVSCVGEFDSDRENIGPILLMPLPGFPVSRLHTAGNILPDQGPEPLVVVHFENPRRGVQISVDCRIWTQDLVYDHASTVGRTRFALFIQ